MWPELHYIQLVVTIDTVNMKKAESDSEIREVVTDSLVATKSHLKQQDR